MDGTSLPDCQLVKILADKAEQRTDTEFDFLGKLRGFCQRVKGEIRQINELFPEYTPHDAEYHLKTLFHVADTVLGRERMEEMNSAELFLLAVSLYGHDWGMAVSDPEEQYILLGELPEGTDEKDLWILRDEHERIMEFARNERLKIDQDEHIQEIPDDLWREYVRQTHAARSGERARRFFESIDGGVADAASHRQCRPALLTFPPRELAGTTARREHRWQPTPG